MAFRTFIRAALFSAALFASGMAAMATTIERVGSALSHPWGMEFLDHDTVLVTEENGTATSIYGVGIDTSITMAPIRAVVSALNKL